MAARNTNNSLQSMFVDGSLVADGSLSIPPGTTAGGATPSVPSTTSAGTSQVAPSTPIFSPEMIAYINQSVTAAVAAAQTPAVAPVQAAVQASTSLATTANVGGVPASSALEASAANFLASGSGKVWLNYDQAFREHAAATKLIDWSCMNVHCSISTQLARLPVDRRMSIRPRSPSLQVHCSRPQFANLGTGESTRLL